MIGLLVSLLFAGSRAATDARGVEPVPLVRLLSAPADYKGKTISTSGIARRRDDGNWALFLDCESARMDVVLNSVRFYAPSGDAAAFAKRLDFKYAMVSGTYLGATARTGSYAGVFDEGVEATPYPLLSELDDAGHPMTVDTDVCKR